MIKFEYVTDRVTDCVTDCVMDCGIGKSKSKVVFGSLNRLNISDVEVFT